MTMLCEVLEVSTSVLPLVIRRNKTSPSSLRDGELISRHVVLLSPSSYGTRRHAAELTEAVGELFRPAGPETGDSPNFFGHGFPRVLAELGVMETDQRMQGVRGGSGSALACLKQAL